MQALSHHKHMPRHIAIIMDGNGRWAEGRGASRIFGHKNAIKAVRETTEYCAENKVGYLTLYAFSTENWARPKFEVDSLMSLLVAAIKDELPNLTKNNVRLLSIGDITKLPADAQQGLKYAKAQTENNSGLSLILALNYSGKWDMERAVKAIAHKVKNGEISTEDIDSRLIADHLSTRGIPDPELMIRTSGEMRISNFLLWQLAYTELYFSEVLWPDFRKKDIEDAVAVFRKRERRFGMTGKQIALQ